MNFRSFEAFTPLGQGESRLPKDLCGDSDGLSQSCWTSSDTRGKRTFKQSKPSLVWKKEWKNVQYLFSPKCRLWCSFSFDFVPNILSHIWQRKGLMPVWVVKWASSYKKITQSLYNDNIKVCWLIFICTLSFRLNFFSQVWHTNRLGFAWLSSCTLRLFVDKNPSPHLGHKKGFAKLWNLVLWWVRYSFLINFLGHLKFNIKIV